MNTNIIEISDQFAHIKGLFIQSTVTEFDRFTNNVAIGTFSEKQEVLMFIAQCGKELKLHTLMTGIDKIYQNIFSNDLIRTFVLCTTDRFFVEIKPFENSLYEYLTGIFHIRNIKDVTVIQSEVLDALVANNEQNEKETTKFFLGNSWIVCVILLLITHRDIIKEVSLLNKK